MGYLDDFNIYPYGVFVKGRINNIPESGMPTPDVSGFRKESG